MYLDFLRFIPQTKAVRKTDKLFVFILITLLRDATQSSLFIILQVQSKCFGYESHSSSGVHKTVTTTSGTVQLPPSNVAKLGHVGWR